MESYFVAVNGQQEGPFSTSQIRSAFAQGVYNGETLVWSQGMSDWQPISAVSALQQTTAATPPLPSGGAQAHEIDY